MCFTEDVPFGKIRRAPHPFGSVWGPDPTHVIRPRQEVSDRKVAVPCPLRNANEDRELGGIWHRYVERFGVPADSGVRGRKDSRRVK
eukprot:4277115-Lingulodinium_polyedra.AAC.1